MATLRSKLMELAARPEGVRSIDPKLSSWTRSRASRLLRELAEQGKVHAARAARNHVVYFTDAARAQGYSAKPAASSRKPPPHAPLGRGQTAAWRAAEPVTTPNTIFTTCPPYAPRFQAVELPGLHGALQRGRVVA